MVINIWKIYEAGDYMKKGNLITIELYVAAGIETKPIKNKIELALKELSGVHEKSGFEFRLRWWQDESAAMPLTGRSQDEYNNMIDSSDMVAVIVHNTLGRYTLEEYHHAVNCFKKNGKFPRIVVYTLPTNFDNDARYEFIKSLRSDDSDYFHSRVDNDEQLIDKIKGELLKIKYDYEAELNLSTSKLKQWDIFLAHSSFDLKYAKELFDMMNNINVFLDSERLHLGDDWDLELSKAQKNSLITAVLVSSKTDTAYYEREEIANAISMSRKLESGHWVIPIYIEEVEDIPYGLRSKHGIKPNESNDIQEVAKRLMDEVNYRKSLITELSL